MNLKKSHAIAPVRMVTSTRVYFFQNIYYALANTPKDFTHRLASETIIFRLDLSAATRIYVKKVLAETSYFVIAVICVFTS